MSVYFDSTANILQLLKDNFGGSGYFKEFYEGDPILIGQSSLPAICVHKTHGEWGLGPTQFDELTEEVTVKVILNKKDDFGGSGNSDLTERKLRVLVEGRDDTTGNLLPESVLGVLRTKLTSVANLTLDQGTTVDYGVVPRPDEVITSEAHVTITIRSLQQVPGRT